MWPLSIIFGVVKSFLGTALGKYVGLGIGGAVLLGGLYAGCQINSCTRMKEELHQYHRADAIRKEDPKVEKRIEEQKKRVDGLSTPDDFDREFDRLQHYSSD